MKSDLLEKLREFLDALETEYGDLEGVEIKLEHPIDDQGKRQSYPEIKEFVITYLHRTEIKDLMTIR